MSNPTADSVEVLLLALSKGEVRAIGGIIYDVEMLPLFNTTIMHGAVRALSRNGVVGERVDSGGAPTWVKRKER